MFDERRHFEGFNRRISRLFESPRLSAASSSSIDKLSSSTSCGTESYDSDRPVSVLSTASSGSLRECRDFYEPVSTAGQEQEHLGNGLVGPDMELMTSAAGSLQAAYREMQNGLKGSNMQSGNNNNAITRKGRKGSRSLSPFGAKVTVITHKLNYVERVVMEILETERMYVQDLRSIVEDYLGGIIDTQELLPMKPEQVSALFGNIEDIYELNSELLQDLDSCKEDPVAVASCFVEKSQDFDIYTQYCTNYPNSVATLTECMRNKVLAKFFRERQELLNHSLPLGSYLLKPVQRILKYHLLLQEIAKHFDTKEEGYEVVEEAIETMTGVAWYINDMKRKHEHAVRLQEIQSLLLNWKGLDLTTYGELVLEGTFRVQRARSERVFFLFDKALFITKKRGDHFVYKTHIPCSSLMLIESTRDSLCFSVTHYKNSKQQQNVQAKNVEEKRLWTHHIKKLILENHHAIIPQKAKEAILEMDAIYPGRYRYSPERLKKTMSTIDPAVTHRSGRRQSDPNRYKYISGNIKTSGVYPADKGRRKSEPAKHILKQLGEKVGIKHSGSDGALLDYGETLQPNINDLTTSHEQPQAEGEKEQLTSAQMSRGSGTELSASEEEEDDEEELHLGDDDQNRDSIQQEAPKGFKRQNSQSSGNAEKRRSVEVSAPEVTNETEKEDSKLKENYSTVLVNSTEVVLVPSDPGEESLHVEEEQVLHPDVHDPEANGEPENTEDIKTFSSEEEEEDATTHESDSILPPSVLDQASVIAERFINNLSRRNSLALEDGKVIGYLTPRLTSRSSSVISLDKIPYQNGSSDFNSHQDAPCDSNMGIMEPTLNKGNSVSTENVFEERERQLCKRRESILSIQDRQLLDKIKTYYDHAEHQDAEFSIKRRESLTYIPTGLVRSSVFKINSLPRYDPIQNSLARQRMDSSTTSASNGNSRHTSWSEVPNTAQQTDLYQSVPQTQQPMAPAKKGLPQNNVPISDEEFKSPEEMIKVWEEIEKKSSWVEDSGVQEGRKGAEVTSSEREDKPLQPLENGFGAHEPLLILEDSDLSTITEESPVPTPESTSPRLFGNNLNNLAFNDQDFKTPIKLHPKIMQLANCLDDDMSEKMKNKVYQLARQYSQRIKGNKPVAHRRLREIEEDLRRNSLPSVQEEKQEEKGKLKPTLSLPTYDHIVLQEHGPTTPTSATFHDKSPKRLSFSGSCDSPGTSSPVKSDCKSPLSPVKTEKFHWPDVRELRSRYIRPTEAGQNLPVNRSHSVPDRMVEHHEENSLHARNKEHISHSYSMNLKCSDTVNVKTKETSPKSKVQVDGTLSTSPKMNGTIEMQPNLRNSGQGLDSFYYISAEAPLENNKKVIIVEKISLPKDPSTADFQNDDTYVHIRSPTTREKISLKAVIERCKAYQESDEYKAREEASKSENATETNPEMVHPESKQESRLSQDSQQTRVKNLREKFQSLNSHSCKHVDLH